MKLTGLVVLWLRLLTLACGLSLSGYLGRYYFLFEQIDSFRVQYFIVAVGGALLALLYRQWLLVAVLVTVAALHASELARFYRSPPATTQTADIRLMSVNLLASNRDSTLLLKEIKRVKPDVIVFQEYTPRWRQSLSAALTDYPHRLEEVIDTPFGIAAYSKLPYQRASIAYFNQRLSPAVDIQVAIGTQPLRILGVHPIPPMSAATYERRNRYFDDVIEQATDSQLPLIVTGDFNATPWSYHFTHLLQAAALISTRDGAGIHPTWPGGFWPLWTPIDHIIHNRYLQSVRFESGKRFGSDHTPVWADLALTAGAAD